MSTESKNHAPDVVVVTNNPLHQEFFEFALSLRHVLSIHRDIDQAMEEYQDTLPNAIVIDEGGRHDLNCERFLEHSRRLKEESPGLIAIARFEGAFSNKATEPNAPSQFLHWPLTTRTLCNAVSRIISEKAENGWRLLPEQAGLPLNLTVEAYKEISDAIAKGEPIDYAGVTESCKPLVDTVASGTHHTLLSAVQSHHNYTYVHSLRVATLLTMFGHGLGIRGDDLLVLSTGGLLHDVGKLDIPEHILEKPGRLLDEEWVIVKDHVARTSQLLRASAGVSKGVLVIAEQHHEKIDGSGYPRGLKGTDLNELARLATIVDVFGALTDTRPYKLAYSQEKAFGILEDMPNEVDQNLVKVFRSIFEPGADLLKQAV